MQISPVAPSPQHYITGGQTDALDAGERHTRSIDSRTPHNQKTIEEVQPDPSSKKGGSKTLSVDSDPGKTVATNPKTPTPVNVGPNISVDPATAEISKAYESVEQEAALFLKRKFAEMKAKETDPEQKKKWDIDPDNTYLVTYDYNSSGKEPYPAKIISRITLTQALIHNAQDTPTGKGYSVPFFEGGPNVEIHDSLPTQRPGIFDFPSRFNPYSPKAHITHNYQGIYVESPEVSSKTYNASNQSAITPKEFKKLIWNADFQKPYTEFLDQFWSDHKEKYPVLAKAAFVKSAMVQLQEGSLSADARELVMRAAGLPGSQALWPDIKYEDLQNNPPKDPNIEVGLLTIGQYQSTDLMYVTDRKPRVDANGNKLPPLTLFYMPGNSSPIHTFTSQKEMKTWLAAQMAEPIKRDALASHFELKDKPNGWQRAGLDETLAGLGTWPEKRETPGGLFSYDHRAFSGKWDPQEFITTKSTNLPFEEVSKRQKDRSYADASVKITSDSDVTKTHIINGLEKAAKAALFLTPLAFVVPEVALALDAFYLASGITTTGIGIDDKKHGKTTGTNRIIFGLFNAATVIAPHVIGTSGTAVEEAAGDSVHPETNVKPDPPPAPSEENGSHVPTQEKTPINGWGDWFGLGQAKDPLLNNKFKAKWDQFKSGDNAALYEKGYNSGRPENMAGYSPGMSSVEIKNLALEPDRTAEEFGTLVRTLEKRRATKSLESFLVFKKEMEAIGGKVRGMPQDFYLSHIEVLTTGECAAMSNTMALAITQGKEDLLIDNLFKAGAGTNTPEATAFRNTLEKLHGNVVYDFHGTQPVRKITPNEIAGELANATESTTSKISDTQHGLIAGVRIENNNKFFFVYDPNFGLVKFASQEAMEKGIDRLLFSGPMAKTFKPNGYESSMPLFEVSTFNEMDFYNQSGSINPNTLFSRPL